MEQRSVKNVFASVWGLIESPSYEKAPKLVNQGTANSRMHELFIRKNVKKDSNVKILQSVAIQTEAHVSFEC